ncbi:MAG: hypothetical protein KKF30_09730 [Proteobacteria bacterium]|nr:hypothetical protein [Pseudomonadota bacterium]MBU4469523.1 hypothetical protein [Pseudomonadota bacterium]MCG2753405.1 hypothetical protein [Desulfobacteraceae bacterium]
MKIFDAILGLALTAAVFGCSHLPDAPPPDTAPAFSERAVGLLQKADLSPFLDKDLAEFYPNNDLLQLQSEYLTGGLMKAPYRSVEIFLFDSPEAALEGVDKRNNILKKKTFNLLPIPIPHQGKPDRTGIDRWWICETPSPVSINTTLLIIAKNNMVFMMYDGTRKYSEMENELWDTATKFFQLVEE